VVVVAIALIAGAFAALALQRSALVDAIDSTLIARVDDISSLLIDGSVPATLTVPGDDDALVQVVDGSRRVVASSANVEGQGPIASVDPPADAYLLTDETLPIGDGEFRLAVRRVDAGGQRFTVVAAASLEQALDATAILAGILAVGVPLLIGLVGFAVWVIIGRTLEPVEAIRSRVASIGDQELDRRVPVPDTDDEIGRLAATMNEMLDRLELAATQQKSFVADASHELRSPLAAIRSQLEVDLVHPDLADWAVSNGEILAETLRMQRLVDDLLLLARSDSGAVAVHHQAVDLDDLVFESAERMREGTAIVIDTFHVSGAQVKGQPEALSRLVRNLIENALRYASGRIEIGLVEADGTATLTVDDDGPGIAVNDRSRVFERFTRLDEARDRDHGGAGLGLAIAYEITNRHHGAITATDSPLGGARFTVTIPTG